MQKDLIRKAGNICVRGTRVPHFLIQNRNAADFNQESRKAGKTKNQNFVLNRGRGLLGSWLPDSKTSGTRGFPFPDSKQERRRFNQEPRKTGITTNKNLF
jgi:hypothetical protein